MYVQYRSSALLGQAMTQPREPYRSRPIQTRAVERAAAYRRRCPEELETREAGVAFL